MKVGIYDRYLATMGGGERYACKMAEVLSHSHEVDLISERPVDLEKVGEQLHIDLSRVSLKIFPYLSQEYASGITKDYDLFVNATYLSSLSNHARRGIYLVYFPTPFDVDFKFKHRLAYLILRGWAERINREDTLQKILPAVGVEPVAGVYDPSRFLLGGYAWTSGRAVVRIKEGQGDRPLKLRIQAGRRRGVPPAQITVRADGEVVLRDKILTGKQRLDLVVPPALLVEGGEVEVVSSTFVPAQYGYSQDSRELGVVISYKAPLPFPRRLLLRCLSFIPLFVINYPRDLAFLDSYDQIISISQYTQSWVKKLWGRDSQILYPPVEIDSLRDGPKREMVISVGRFFTGNHNKKQLEMVRAFKEIYRKGKRGWEYHLVGGVEDIKEHRRYLQQVRRESEGYPIYIHENASWEELVRLLSQSKIFWHASGLGEDENKHPDKFEHFGITTVEAMASGCVPVVIARGGQREIVQDGVDGFLFEDWPGLVETTVRLMEDQELLHKVGHKAKEKSNRFSVQSFVRHLEDIVGELQDVPSP